MKLTQEQQGRRKLSAYLLTSIPMEKENVGENSKMMQCSAAGSHGTK